MRRSSHCGYAERLHNGCGQRGVRPPVSGQLGEPRGCCCCCVVAHPVLGALPCFPGLPPRLCQHIGWAVVDARGDAVNRRPLKPQGQQPCARLGRQDVEPDTQRMHPGLPVSLAAHCLVLVVALPPGAPPGVSCVRRVSAEQVNSTVRRRGRTVNEGAPARTAPSCCRGCRGR